MEIKRISKDEYELVIQLFDKYRVFYKQDSNLGLAKTFITERLNNNESVIFVALIEHDKKETAIGFTQLYPKYSSVRTVKNWILNDLYVDVNHRKQSVGEKLIKTAMEFAKADGANFVELSTAINNFTAQSLYENIGFVKQVPEKDFFNYRINLI
jgi:ribosomal protein S18 acetylase RimI-like enzyme